MFMLDALPAAAADDAEKLVVAPKELMGQQGTASCRIAYAQETSHNGREVYGISAQGAGTIYTSMSNIPGQQDRPRSMQECANQNPRKNNRGRCVVTLTRRVVVHRERAFLTDPTIEWTNK